MTQLIANIAAYAIARHIQYQTVNQSRLKRDSSEEVKPETELRNAIRESLLKVGVLVMTNAQVGRTFHGGLGVGSSDLVAVVRGRFVGLEVKVDKGKLSSDQRAWGEILQEHGGYYFVVRSIVEAVEAVRSVAKEAA